MKRRLLPLFLVLVMILAIGLTACAPNEAEEESQESAEKTEEVAATDTPAAEEAPEEVSLEGEKVSFSTFTQWYNTKAGLKEGFAKVEELTGVEIEVNVYPDGQYVDIMNTKLAAGESEDFFAYQGKLFLIRAPQELEPLDGPWADTYRQSTLDYVTREDGHIVAVPYGTAEALGVIYNKKVFEAAGIEGPPKTYEEFISACDSIKATGITPIYMPNKDGWTAQIPALITAGTVFKQNPDKVEKLLKNELKFQDFDEFVEIGNKVAALVDQGYLNDNYMSGNFNQALEEVALGNAGMFFGGTWLYADVAKKYPDNVADVGMMPVSLTDELIATIGATDGAFYVPASGENKEVAKAVIQSFISDEVKNTALSTAFTGVSFDSNFENEVNPWIEEMQGYIDSMGIEVQEQFKDEYIGKYKVDTGSVEKCFQSIISGLSVEDAYTDLYNDFAAKNKAKGIDGF